MMYEVYHDTDVDLFRIRGLKSKYDDDDEGQILLYRIPYPETEAVAITAPLSADSMHSALYDMYQWHDGLNEGDKFTTPFGNFKCVSFHVVKDV